MQALSDAADSSVKYPDSAPHLMISTDINHMSNYFLVPDIFVSVSNLKGND